VVKGSNPWSSDSQPGVITRLWYLFFCKFRYDVMYVYLVDYSEKDLGFSSQDATFLISIIGILNTFGEVIVGWLGDQVSKSKIKSYVLLLKILSTIPF